MGVGVRAHESRSCRDELVSTVKELDLCRPSSDSLAGQVVMRRNWTAAAARTKLVNEKGCGEGWGMGQ
jgi:hypothetical protein